MKINKEEGLKQVQVLLPSSYSLEVYTLEFIKQRYLYLFFVIRNLLIR